MAENQPTTPEQQLLKLIEGQNKPGDPAKAAKAKGRPSFGLGAILGSLAFWKRRAKRKTRGARLGFGIAEVNKALIAAVLLLAVYVVFDAAASARNLQKPPSFVPMSEPRANADPKESVAPLEETSYYLQKVSARDIFREGKKESPREEAPVAAAEAETAEAVQDLALVGISWSANPDAIIEDKAKQRTYFVKRGQEAGEGVRVEAIFKDHVVVTYEDREYELR